MAKKLKIKKVKTVRKVRAAKQPKIVAISGFSTSGDGQSTCFGLGADGKLYSWSGLKPAGWKLQEFQAVVPSPEQVAVMLQAQQEAKNAADQPTLPFTENRRSRRAAVANGAAVDPLQ